MWKSWPLFTGLRAPKKPGRNRKKQGKPKYMLDSMGGNAAITPALEDSPPENAEGITFRTRPGRPVFRGSGGATYCGKG